MLYYRSVERSYINVHYFYVHYGLSIEDANSIISRYKVDFFKNKTGIMVHFKDFEKAHDKWIKKQHLKEFHSRPKDVIIDENKCYYFGNHSERSYTRIAFIGKRKLCFENFLSCSMGGRHYKYLFQKSDILKLISNENINHIIKLKSNMKFKNFSKQETKIINYFLLLFRLFCKNWKDLNHNFTHDFKEIIDYLKYDKKIPYTRIIGRMWDAVPVHRDKDL